MAADSMEAAIHKMPAETLLQILGYLGPAFFEEDLGRLTVSKWWYSFAIRIRLEVITLSPAGFGVFCRATKNPEIVEIINKTTKELSLRILVGPNINWVNTSWGECSPDLAALLERLSTFQFVRLDTLRLSPAAQDPSLLNEREPTALARQPKCPFAAFLSTTKLKNLIIDFTIDNELVLALAPLFRAFYLLGSHIPNLASITLAVPWSYLIVLAFTDTVHVDKLLIRCFSDLVFSENEIRELQELPEDLGDSMLALVSPEAYHSGWYRHPWWLTVQEAHCIPLFNFKGSRMPKKWFVGFAGASKAKVCRLLSPAWSMSNKTRCSDKRREAFVRLDCLTGVCTELPDGPSWGHGVDDAIHQSGSSKALSREGTTIQWKQLAVSPAQDKATGGNLNRSMWRIWAPRTID